MAPTCSRGSTSSRGTTRRLCGGQSNNSPSVCMSTACEHASTIPPTTTTQAVFEIDRPPLPKKNSAPVDYKLRVNLWQLKNATSNYADWQVCGANACWLLAPRPVGRSVRCPIPPELLANLSHYTPYAAHPVRSSTARPSSTYVKYIIYLYNIYIKYNIFTCDQTSDGAFESVVDAWGAYMSTHTPEPLQNRITLPTTERDGEPELLLLAQGFS